MESPAAIGKKFRRAFAFVTRDASLFNHFRVGMVIAFTLGCQGNGVFMITSAANSASYLRSAQASPSKTTLTKADAEPAAEAAATTATEDVKLQHPDLDFRPLDVSQLKITPLDTALRDLFATVCWEAQLANSATDVPDNASQNIYANVKVNGKVVATLYNGGSSMMTNEAAAKVGDLRAPPGLTGGPDLARWRAERIAEAVGGTVEKASTAIAQSEWNPRGTTSSTRTQSDAAFEAMMAGQRQAVAQRSAGYPPEPSRSHTDFSA